METAPPIQWLDEINRTELTDGNLPLHAVVRNGLLRVIESKFDDGQRFWSESELTDRLNVSRVTVRRALSDLSTGGSLRRFRARGTFVRKATYSAPKKETTSSVGLKSVGIFIAQYNSQYFADMLDEFSSAIRDLKVDMRIYRTHKGDTGARAIGQLNASPTEEAIILFANDPHLTRDLYIELEASRYRAVTVDVVIPDYPSCYVGTNNDMGIRLGLRHLLGLGHRRIAFLLNEPEDSIVSRSRLGTFLSVASEQNIPEMKAHNAHLHLWDDPISAAYNLMPAVWSDPDGPPTAIMCASDAGASGVLRWCAEQKLSVPGDLSVVGFDDDRSSRYLSPPLTTIAHPRTNIAKRAVEMLLGTGLSHEFLPPSLVVRNSTGQVPAGRNAHSLSAHLEKGSLK